MHMLDRVLVASQTALGCLTDGPIRLSLLLLLSTVTDAVARSHFASHATPCWHCHCHNHNHKQSNGQTVRSCRHLRSYTHPATTTRATHVPHATKAASTQQSCTPYDAKCNLKRVTKVPQQPLSSVRHNSGHALHAAICQSCRNLQQLKHVTQCAVGTMHTCTCCNAKCWSVWLCVAAAGQSNPRSLKSLKPHAAVDSACHTKLSSKPKPSPNP
jgi:hypothetical protein